MVRVGDKVIVNIDHAGIINQEMTVISLGNADYYEYMGDHIIVEDDKGITAVARMGEFIPVPSKPKAIKKYNWIALKSPDKGTQRIFYQVLDVFENGLTFTDDNGNVRTYPIEDVEEVNMEDMIHYMNDLQLQIETLRNEINNLKE